ncbi:MAG TPA: CBS domain-containing protein [Euzebyales bacterium]|nr:CBS domain-containing protein [Euzebyales bacterium]
MKHWVIAYRHVPGAPAALRRRLVTDVADMLRTAMDGDDGQVEPDGSLLLQLPAHVAGVDMHKQVRVRTGVASDHGARTCIPLQWEAEPGRHAFPVFTGTIELEPMSSRMAQLTVVGAVTPPLGPVGGLAEATVLGALAERTTQDLADRLAEALVEGREEPAAKAATGGPAAQLTVADIMTVNPLVLHVDTPVRTAALLLFYFDVAGAPVRTDDGGLVGVLSESDLLAVQATPRLGLGGRAEDSRVRHRARTVGEACSRPAHVVAPDATVSEAAAMLWDADIGRLIVVSGAEVVGVVSRHDVLRALLRDDAETQAALDELLRARDDDVIVQVEWGVATLMGVVTYHSTARRLAQMVREVDGVVDVDSQVDWKIDDLVPPVLP